MKDKIISIGFVSIIMSFLVLSLVFKDKDISKFERRRLANKDSLKENFTANLDKYLTEQFPFRDNFLTINNTFNRYILNNQEYNNVYVKDDFIIEKNYPLDYKSMNNFINKINLIKDKYLVNNKCFYTIIPDKSSYLNNKDYLTIDYDYLYKELNSRISFSYINIKDLLNLEDYYKTDIHLKQNTYFKVIKELSKYLDFEYQDIKYQENIYNDFKGSSFYKVPFSNPEKLIYLTNNILGNAKVKHLEYEDNFIYKKDALDSFDAYNIFLSGPSSLIQIENNMALNDKELIIFRDSFGSSLAPLLVPFYKKITLIDLRYINMNMINKYISIDNQDVLFLYSTLSVNNSYLLKIS